jgi:preprotein translocase subunit SecB
MSKKDKTPAAETPATDAPAAENAGGTVNNGQPSMILRAQYVKDLSFENPRSPASLFNLREAPHMEVNINLGAQRIEEHIVELTIQVGVRATSENHTVFLADLTYAGLLEMHNIPAEQADRVVFINGAQLIYPFARRVIADVTRDGGFPPLQLEPLDFVAMFNNRGTRQSQPVANPVEETAAN